MGNKPPQHNYNTALLTKHLCKNFANSSSQGPVTAQKNFPVPVSPTFSRSSVFGRKLLRKWGSDRLGWNESYKNNNSGKTIQPLVSDILTE